MLHGLIVLALLLYAGAAIQAIFSLRRALRPKGRTVDSWPGYLLFQFAFFTHTLSAGVLAASEPVQQMVPTSGGDFYFWLSWALSFLFWAGGRSLRYSAFGGMLSATVVLFLVSSSFLVHVPNEPTLGSTPSNTPHLVFLLLVHVVPAVCAQALVVLASCVSVLLLIRQRQLKSREVDLTLKGPSLQLLAGVNESFLFYSFVSMTVAVISGALWSYLAHRPLISADPLEWAAWIGWGILAVVLHGATKLGWSSRRVAVGTVCTGVFLAGALLLILSWSRGVFHG